MKKSFCLKTTLALYFLLYWIYFVIKNLVRLPCKKKKKNTKGRFMIDSRGKTETNFLLWPPKLTIHN